MTKKRHRTEAEYEELARSYAAEPIRADEVRSVEIGPALLRMGRPAKGTRTGKTPPLTIRLPEALRAEIAHRVEAGESGSESELVRRAVIEYVERHPARR
jgi:hypothetical protein